MTQKKEYFADVLAAAQAEIKNVRCDATNPHFGSKYATLPACRNAILPAFNRRGIFIYQKLITEEGRITVTTYARWRDEEIQASTTSLPIESRRNVAQSMISSVTYMRRAQLCAFAGVAATEDDDANAMDQEQSAPPAKPKPKAKPKAKPKPKKAAPKFDATTYPRLIDLLKGSRYMDPMPELIEYWKKAKDSKGDLYNARYHVENWDQAFADRFIDKIQAGELVIQELEL